MSRHSVHNYSHSFVSASLELAELARGVRNGLLMFFIIELLPWEEDAEGKTILEIQEGLLNIGFEIQKRRLERVMRAAMRCANIEFEGSKPRRFKRFHPHSISACLSEKCDLYGVQKAGALSFDDWRSA